VVVLTIVRCYIFRVAERINLTQHHADTLRAFLKGATLSNVNHIVINKIIPCIEDLELEGGLEYAFLKDPVKREEYTKAMITAASAFIVGNYIVISNRNEEGEINADIICMACGNFINGRCSFDPVPDK
jgi:hypothetical protein